MAEEHKDGDDAGQRKSRLERRVHNKQDREAMIARQREQFRKRQRNKRVFNYAILAIILAAVAYGIYVYASSRNTAGQYDALARCLTESGAVMYGTDWCPHCQEQKREFGNSFKYVTYVNCDLELETCNATNITGYPTWVFRDGLRAEGVQAPAVLAERTGCQQ